MGDGREEEGAIFDTPTDRMPLPLGAKGPHEPEVAPSEFQRALSDQAFAVWASRNGVADAALRAAQAQRRTMGLHQALVEQGQVPLEAVLEVMRPTVVLACRRCKLHYPLGERLVAATIAALRCAGCGGLLKTVRGANSSSSGIDNSQAISGERLGVSSSGEGPGEPFTLVGLLGRGGMGNVYAAVTPDGTQVAVKLLHEELLHDPDLKVRFEREGTVLAQIQHPNVVATLGRGFDPTSGRPYLMLEYVNGRDLESVLVERPHQRLSPSEAVFVIDRCARGLAAAHAQGVIHRDVKPSNVLVTPLGEVKLSDFGIALSSDVKVRLTSQNEVMGTPQYVPPEVLLGQPWSPPADLYSLGSFAFRILTGRPLFADAVGMTGILQAHIEIEPPKITDVVPELPAALAEIVSRLLEKDPEDRPSAQELSGLLEEAQLLEQTSAIAALWSKDASPDALEQSIDISLSSEGGAGAYGEVEPGQVIGRYRILREIGKGNTGVVYEAAHLDTQARVAIKVLKAESIYDTQALKRFDLEARSQALLQQAEGVVTIHAAGRTAGGQPYLVMDYVEGPTLDQALRSGIERHTALDALQSVAEALAQAHAHDLVHRDVKPENIVLTPDGRAWLTDFGVARFLGSDQRLTQSGDVVGTLAYMSPEQADKNLGASSPASDVYSLGAVLYELLTGGPPHQGVTAIAVYASLLRGDPIPRPSSLAPDVPPKLEHVCMQALSRDPSERFSDGGAFALALRAAREASQEGSLRLGSGALPRLDARQRKRVLMTLGGAVALVLLLMIAAISLRVSQDRARERSKADVRERLSELKKHLEAGALGEAVQLGEPLLARIGADHPDRAELVALLRDARVRRIRQSLRRGDVRGAREQLPESAVWEGEVPVEAAWVRLLSGDFAAALPHLPATESVTRAYAAGWSGDAAALKEAAAAVGGPRGSAIAWELIDTVDPAPPALEIEEGGAAKGWRAIAGGNQALGRGLPAIAGIHFDEARGDDDPQVRMAAYLGLLRLAIARGDFRAAVEPAGKAWELASSPLDKGRCLAAAAPLGLVLPLRQRQTLDALLGEELTAKAERAAFGLPGVRIVRAARAAADWTAASGPPQQDGLTLLGRARALARGRRRDPALQLAWSLVRPAPPPAARSSSFAEADRVACAWGRDGPAGLLLARGAELAIAAERGNSRAAAERAAALLEQARLLRPLSPALWVAAARAALVRRALDAADAALQRAERLSPKDPGVLALQARLLSARLAKDRRILDQQRLGGEIDGRRENQMAARLEPVLARWAEALRAETPGTEFAHRLRLEVASARLEIARRRSLGAGLGLPAAFPDGVRARIAADLAPLVPAAADWSRLREARAGLAKALAREAPEEIAAAERALAQAAEGLHGVKLEALLVRASSGDRPAALAYLAAAGDLPARGMLAIRHAAMAPIQTQGAKLKHAAAICRLPLARLLAEKSAGRLGRSADSFRRLAALAIEAPELYGLVHGWLYHHEAQVKRMVNNHPAELDPVARGGAPADYLARALALRSYRMRWSKQGAKASEQDELRQRAHEQRARTAYHDASRAVQLDPRAAGAQLLRALTMGSLGRGAGSRTHWDPRIKPDVHHALACARAGAPWVGPILVYHLHFYRPRELPWLLDALLSQGYLKNYRVLLVSRFEAELGKQLGDVRGHLDDLWEEWDPAAAQRLSPRVRQRFPRLSLLLELTAGGRGGSSPSAELVDVLRKRLRGEGSEVPFAAARLARQRGQASESVNAARAALDRAAPPGVWGEHTLAPRLLRAPLVIPDVLAHQDRFNLLVTSFLPAERRLWEEDMLLRSPESAVHIVAEKRVYVRRPPFLSRLPDPFGRDQSALRGVIEAPVQERLLRWLLQAKAPDPAEVRLALDRATAFARTDSSASLLARLVVDVVRPAALRATKTTRARLLELALAALRQAQVVSRNPHPLWLLVGHLELDRAGSLTGKAKRILVGRARETLESVTPRRLPERLRVLHRWGRVRAFVASGDVARGRDAARGLRKRPAADQRLLRAFLKRDPLHEELRRVREYRLLSQ